MIADFGAFPIPWGYSWTSVLFDQTSKFDHSNGNIVLYTHAPQVSRRHVSMCFSSTRVVVLHPSWAYPLYTPKLIFDAREKCIYRWILIEWMRSFMWKGERPTLFERSCAIAFLMHGFLSYHDLMMAPARTHPQTQQKQTRKHRAGPKKINES